MRSKITLKKLLFIVSITAIVFYIIILFIVPVLHNRLSYAKSAAQVSSQISQNSIEINPVASIAIAEQASSALPLRLKIPEIDVDTTIESVGLTANGEMDVPKSPDNVAWFNLGARPGNIGSAVIAGHFGILKNGNASVFDNLHKLGKGDKLNVEDDKGVVITFVVQESRSYDPNADASDVFSSNDGKAHLNLVTCQGWDKISESYTKRLVIFTDKE